MNQVDTIPLMAATDRTATITLHLTGGGVTTAAIKWNDTAAAIKAALIR